MTTARRGTRLAALALAGLLLASCGSSSAMAPAQRNVFTLLTGLTISFPTQVREITDVGLPGLYNTSGHPVRLISVSLPGQPRAFRVLNVRAYNVNQVGYGDIGGQQGDLPSECPRQFIPHPISSFTIRPHSIADYFVVIAFTINKPGTYRLGKAKII